MAQVCKASSTRRKPPATPAQAARRRGPIDRRLEPEIFRALGDATRIRLVSCLAKCARPCSVSEVAACCTVDLSVVSRHLRVLERAGVLAATREGRTVRYRVRFDEVGATLRGLADALDACAADAPASDDCRPDSGCCPS